MNSDLIARNTSSILSDMPLGDKIRLLCGTGMMDTASFPDYGVESITMSDGPIGLRYQKVNKDSLGIHRSEPATVLLSGPAIAATWNPECARQMGQIIGREARYYGVDLVLGPAVNLVRNPLCGRNAEYLSEDPLLSGTLGGEYIKGVREQGVGCCIKHFAANNQETEREYLNVRCDEATLRELYLKSFEIAIRNGNPDAVMTSLSMINGEYCSSNFWLLTEVLRKEWGFQGLVMTDWLGLDDRAKAIKAGLDLEMPGTCGESSVIEQKEYLTGRLSIDDINKASGNVIKLSATLHDMASKAAVAADDIFTNDYNTVTRAAEESVVLLQNRNRILPLKSGASIAVIGAYAQKPLFQARGSGNVNAAFSANGFGEIRKINGIDQTSYSEGYLLDSSSDMMESGKSTDDVATELTEKAVDASAKADTVIMFLASDPDSEGEGNDRTEYKLPDNQVNLLHRICSVNSRVVAVVMNGGAVPMPWAGLTDGILECFYGGEGIGAAVARILFGQINPSGHMPVSVPYRIENIISWENFAHHSETVEYHEGIFMGYRGYLTKGIPVQWPFGFGLSYTDFDLAGIHIENDCLTDQDTSTLEVQITNTGNCAGAQVVQLYLSNENTRRIRPIRELRGYQKIYLEAGETRTISFQVTPDIFRVWDDRIEGWSVTGGNYGLQIGFSCEDIRQEVTVHMTPVHPVPDPITGWDKAERLLATTEGKEIFNQLADLIQHHARPVLSSKSASEMSAEDFRDYLKEQPLRLLHLMVWTELTDSDFLSLLDQANQALYKEYLWFE